jgi:prepilin-type N-terminal cleavage/methylation domain-containing protein
MITQLRRGFTLVELLVVIAILAILSTLGITNFQTAKIKARDLERKSDLQTISKSLESYVNDHRSYPLSNVDGEIICQAPSTTCDWGDPFTDGTSTYAVALPAESNESYAYIYDSSTGADYTLYAHLENTQDPSINESITTMCGDVECNYKITSSNIQ